MSMSKNLIIAIDGPAGSGKSSTAKIVAQKLGYIYIDTGAMYRAITFLVIRAKILGKEKQIIELAESCKVDLDFVNGKTEIKVNDEDLTDKIRSVDVNENVSDVSKIEGVRKVLVKKQRKIGASGLGIVMEGRDITTVVFPNADVKIFLTATLDKRAIRRAKEFEEKGTKIPVENVKENLHQRDIIDSSRKVSPLRQVEDAVVVDTSYVTIDEQVKMILDEAAKKANELGIKLNIN